VNRSILIVICDFIITSMIYLNGGFSATESPFRDGGGATIDRSTVNIIINELEQQRNELESTRRALLAANAKAGGEAQRKKTLDRINRDLAETRAKLEFMERRARLTRENSGPLSPAALQKELEEEIRQKNLAKAKFEQLQSELATSRENLLRNDKNFASLQQQHNAVLKELALRSASLENAQNKLSSASGEVARLNERLSSRQLELERRQSDLTAVRQALSSAQSSAGTYRRKLTDAENDLAFLRGRSNAMEKELATARDRLLASEKSIKQREIELAAAHTRLENMQNVLKNAVSDLTNTRTRLAGESAKREAAQNELARLRGDYKAVSTKLQTAENRLRSDVLTRYSQAAVKLRQHIREKRLLVDRDEIGELYLPLVSVDGRSYLISALRRLGGSRQNSSALSDVTALQYSASTPGVNTPAQQLAGPIWVENSDCRVAMLEVPEPKSTPLTLLTKKELKQRGIQDLYLFKVNSFGKDSTILDSRCSMSFENDDDYLYIRNGARVSSELKAEVGDLVLTKQGELVAVVVALENYDFNRQQEARCFVFSSLPDVRNMSPIKLEKTGGHYREFCDKLNFWLEQAKPLDAKKRRR